MCVPGRLRQEAGTQPYKLYIILCIYSDVIATNLYLPLVATFGATHSYH